MKSSVLDQVTLNDAIEGFESSALNSRQSLIEPWNRWLRWELVGMFIPNASDRRNMIDRLRKVAKSVGCELHAPDINKWVKHGEELPCPPISFVLVDQL